MLDGIFRNPTEILFGRTALAGIGPRLRAFGGKVLIVHGGSAYARHGIGERVRAELGRAEVEYLELGGVRPNPLAGPVYEGIALCREHKVRAILAVGGGSVIDTAKAIGIGVDYAGDFFDFFDRKAVPARMLPVGVVLTVFGAGSESSDGAVIDKNERKLSCGSPLMFPTFSVLDPTLTLTVPPYLLACGIFDSTCHVLERYFSPSQHVQTSDELCFALLRTLSDLGPKLMQSPDDYELRANVMWASKLAHDNTVGFGRKHDWGTHTIAHEVGAKCDKPHGSVLAVLFPAWMQHVQPFHVELFAAVGRRVFGLEGESDDVGKRAIGEFRGLTRRLGLPSTLRELGITKKDDLEAIATACGTTTASGTIGNLRRLPKNEVDAILEIASGS